MKRAFVGAVYFNDSEIPFKRFNDTFGLLLGFDFPMTNMRESLLSGGMAGL